MKKLIVLVAVLLAGACAPEKRYVMTEADVAAAAEAKKKGMTSWTDTEQQQHAFTCLTWINNPFPVCIAWKPDPPAGWFDCSDDTTAYSGERLFMWEPNGTWWCAGYTGNGSYGAVGDYNDAVSSVKVNGGSPIRIAADPNQTGDAQAFYPNGNTLQAVNATLDNRMSSVMNLF